MKRAPGGGKATPLAYGDAAAINVALPDEESQQNGAPITLAQAAPPASPRRQSAVGTGYPLRTPDSRRRLAADTELG